MNDTKRVVQFTLIATLLLLGLSIYTEVSGTSASYLKNISLLSDVMRAKTAPLPGTPASTEVIVDKNGKKVPAPTAAPDVYKLPGIITAFHDTAAPAMPRLAAKLADIKKGKKRKIRIAWLGDSMIEGDLITQTVRKRLQQYFGGAGVGFVKMQSLDVKSRATVTMDWHGDWKEESFKSDTHTAPLGFSGHVYFPVSGTTELRDVTIKDTTGKPLYKSLICGKGGPASLTFNGKPISFNPAARFNRIVLDSTPTRAATIKIEAPELPVYGVSFESADGIVLDNFSFRGISGVELGKLDTSFLKEVMAGNEYDLVVLEYGANLMFRPNDVNYSWYEQKMEPVLRNFRKALPGADFLLISTADRAFKYDGEWKTAVGLDSLLDVQARMARKNGMAFFNLYQSMGGYGAIARWADSSTAFANKDYIHPNHRGAELLGNMLADAFIAEARKYNTTVSAHH